MGRPSRGQDVGPALEATTDPDAPRFSVPNKSHGLTRGGLSVRLSQHLTAPSYFCLPIPPKVGQYWADVYGFTASQMTANVPSEASTNSRPKSKWALVCLWQLWWHLCKQSHEIWHWSIRSWWITGSWWSTGTTLLSPARGFDDVLRVLVVDDSCFNCRIMHGHLRRLNPHWQIHALHKAEDALASLERAAAAGEPFDIVVMDEELGVDAMRGSQAIETIRLSEQQGVASPLLIVSWTSLAQTDAARLHEAGADLVWGKPPPASMAEQLHDAFTGRAATPPRPSSHRWST